MSSSRLTTLVWIWQEESIPSQSGFLQPFLKFEKLLIPTQCAIFVCAMGFEILVTLIPKNC